MRGIKNKEEKPCYNPFCNNTIKKDDFRATNPDLTGEEIDACWNADELKLFCCECIREGSHEKLLDFLKSLSRDDKELLLHDRSRRSFEIRVSFSINAVDGKDLVAAKHDLSWGVVDSISRYFRKFPLARFSLDSAEIIELRNRLALSSE